SGPGRKDFDLLIKRGSPLADVIVSTPRGGKLQVSSPAGKGYPMDQARGANLFVIGVGSGMAPLRAVIQTILADRVSFGLVSFIYGARNSTGFPYTAEVDSWKAHDIE